MVQILQIGDSWQVDGSVSMDTANALLQASNLLTMENGTQIDFSKATEVDTSAVSLMLEWRRRANKEKRQIKFVNLPASLSSLTQLYGVSELID